MPEIPLVVDRPAPIAAVVRRRQRRSAARWIVPLICAMALAGFCIWLLQREQVRLGGELPAEVVSDFQIPPQVVPPALIDVDAEIRAAMLEDLAETPERVISPGVMSLEFRGSEEGLLVTLEPAPTAELVRVRGGADRNLVDFRKEHAREWSEVRRRHLADAARDFARAWQRAAEAGIPLDSSPFLTSLGLTAMVKGLGYQVRAIAGDRIYPCAYEDADGSLYFILPAGTSEFRLEGREDPHGSVPFPGRYEVRVRRSHGRGGLRRNRTPQARHSGRIRSS